MRSLLALAVLCTTTPAVASPASDFCRWQIAQPAYQIMLEHQRGVPMHEQSTAVEDAYTTAWDKSQAAVYLGMIAQAGAYPIADSERAQRDVSYAFASDYWQKCTGASDPLSHD